MRPSFSFLLLLSAFSFSLPPTPLEAQESSSPAISTERPTAGPSPDLIPRGSLQLENGAGLTRQSGASVLDLPENFLRIGLTDRMEVRFQASNIALRSTVPGGTSQIQSQDLVLSAKFLISGPNKITPKSAIVSLSVPTGGLGFTSDSTDPTVDLIWTQAFRHGYFLNEVAQATLTTLSGARRPLWSPSIAGGRALSDTLTAFAEYAPNVLPDDSRSFLADGGFAVAHHNFQQWDLRAGLCHDSSGVHPSVMVGYSIRRDHFFFGSQR